MEERNKPPDHVPVLKSRHQIKNQWTKITALTKEEYEKEVIQLKEHGLRTRQGIKGILQKNETSLFSTKK